MTTIIELHSSDKPAIISVINDAVCAHKGDIPADDWKEPYTSAEELDEELAAGVQFYGLSKDGELVGVAGIQHLGDVDLIRHIYVRNDLQRQGVGSALLRHLFALVRAPEVLIGTYKDATWAIRFYKQHGFEQVYREETDRLLERYWHIPRNQIEKSVVLRLREPVTLDAL
ncbi:MAG: GNAT family N-acetyltransferase [Halobacteriota archaeon]